VVLSFTKGTVSSEYFKISESKNQQVPGFKKKTETKEPAGSKYFKTLKELKVHSQFFPGSLTLELFPGQFRGVGTTKILFSGSLLGAGVKKVYKPSDNRKRTEAASKNCPTLAYTEG
jgi:hypothetical protein